MGQGSWRGTLIERLAAGVRADGGWGYRTETASRSEPTALAALALAAYDERPDLRSGGLRWLRQVQGRDGSVCVSSDVTESCWPTALAVLAWLLADVGPKTESSSGAADRAMDWLLRVSGIRTRRNRQMYGHDTTLFGWSWTAHTHSWVEPTGYAILALRAGGRGGHERVREGADLLMDRALPAGGWNYGNTRVLHQTLRPFPATTGLALAALAGIETEVRVEAAITYLTRELARIRSPYSLGWGLIGLTAWDDRPAAAEGWLAESASRVLRRRPMYLDDAVLLLGAAERQVLSKGIAESGHESDEGEH